MALPLYYCILFITIILLSFRQENKKKKCFKTGIQPEISANLPGLRGNRAGDDRNPILLLKQRINWVCNC